jgi:hypothetical protein
VEVTENEFTDLGTIKLVRQTGSVKITSEPSGVTVIQDGKELGTTPLELLSVPTGEVHYMLTMSDYLNTNVSEIIVLGKETALRVMMQRDLKIIAKRERGLAVRTAVQKLASKTFGCRVSQFGTGAEADYKFIMSESGFHVQYTDYPIKFGVKGEARSHYNFTEINFEELLSMRVEYIGDSELFLYFENHRYPNADLVEDLKDPNINYLKQFIADLKEAGVQVH